MKLNFQNLDRLISHLEALPPEEFNMRHTCGTACCIGGHMLRLFGTVDPGRSIDFNKQTSRVFTPEGWRYETDTNKAYPLPRAVRMLRHLRAEFLRTGTVVVDWDAPEATETPRKAWATPVVIGAYKPLPSSLTSLLREPGDVISFASTEA